MMSREAQHARQALSVGASVPCVLFICEALCFRLQFHLRFLESTVAVVLEMFKQFIVQIFACFPCLMVTFRIRFLSLRPAFHQFS